MQINRNYRLFVQLKAKLSCRTPHASDQNYAGKSLLDRDRHGIRCRPAIISDAERMVARTLEVFRIACLARIDKRNLSVSRADGCVDRLAAAGTGDKALGPVAGDRSGQRSRCPARCEPDPNIRKAVGICDADNHGHYENTDKISFQHNYSPMAKTFGVNTVDLMLLFLFPKKG